MTGWQDILIFAVTQFVMLIGLVGSLIPLFPGLLIMWLASLSFGFLHGWNPLGIVLFIVITVLFVLSTFVDNLFMGAGAYKGGAHWVSIVVALVAGIAGTIIFPPFGGIIAAPLAVFLVEFARVRDARKALRALTGMATGFGISYVVRFGMGLVVMALWWLWVWKG